MVFEDKRELFPIRCIIECWRLSVQAVMDARSTDELRKRGDEFLGRATVRDKGMQT